MARWLYLLISIGTGVLLIWIAAVVVIARSGHGMRGLAEAGRLLPDLVRLVSRLARDRSLPPRVRLTLWVTLAYLASPVDLVPDFIPVAGYADDAVVVALALRSAVRAAGTPALDRHWPGTPEGLAVVYRLAGHPPPGRPAPSEPAS